MKQCTYIVSLFLAIIVMIISFYPCADRYVSPINQVESVVDHVVKNQHAAHESDACSPFCACVCCAVSMDIMLTDYTLVVLMQAEIKEKTNLPSPFVEAVAYHIWQPPKLV